MANAFLFLTIRRSYTRAHTHTHESFQNDIVHLQMQVSGGVCVCYLHSVVLAVELVVFKSELLSLVLIWNSLL